jgi:hypothetical protein
LFPGLGEYAGLSLERIVFACFWTLSGVSRDSAIQGV